MKREGWSVGQIALALYPFGAGAMVVNLFFAGLIGSWMGLPVITPLWAVVGGAMIGVPVTWAFARHIRNLMNHAQDS